MNLNRLKSEKGQSVILMAMVILSFLMFFSFVINTGLLIAAKISVQTAADAAAYAGAATQARQLNAISFLNYDMMRQYKKFIYRYSFVSSLGNRDFPNEPVKNPSGPIAIIGTPNGTHYSFWKDDYSPQNNGSVPSKTFQANLINVPIVCIPLTTTGQRNDACLKLNLPNNNAILNSLFKNTSLQTQITQTLIQNIQQINATSNQVCREQGSINLFVLIQWLFRSSTDNGDLNAFENVLGNLPPDQKTTAINTLTSLVTGLGLYPRNILTMLRMQTLEGFINTPALQGATQESIASLESSGTLAEANERSILAFKSALSNLNDDVLSHASVQMTELQSNALLKLSPVQSDFNTYVQLMDAISSNNSTNNQGSATICQSAIVPFVAQQAPLAMKREPGGPVYYAVKIKATAKLLFLPLKDGLELEAVSAAKPFGARLGPAELSPSYFVESITPGTANGQVINDCSGVGGCNSPSVPLNGQKRSYESEYIKELASVATTGGNSVNLNGLLAAQDRALAPSPYDIGTYNILPPTITNASTLDNQFISFSSITSPPPKAQASSPPTVYRFYAPLFPQSGGDPMSTVDHFLDQMFPTTSVQNDPKLHINLADLKSTLHTQISSYINNTLKSNRNLAENQESITFAAIELPIQNLVTPDRNGGTQYWLTQAQQVLTAWGKTSSSSSTLQPRFGYSVKFVALHDLLKANMADPDGDLAKVNH